MGGIIEDKIFEALMDKRLNVRGVQEEIRNLRPAYERSYSTLDHHLRKMVRLQQLDRERVDGVYFYFNPVMQKGVKNGI